ncbi:MAG: hypothetical protein AB7U82_30515 [Blastocatellales bacterium]
MSGTPQQTLDSSSQYEGLRFSFAEMEREIENMRHLASHFLERASAERVIPVWQQQLSTFKGQPPGSQTRWSIKETDPIQTIISPGKYEPRGRGGKTVFGRVSGAWDIQIPQITGKKKGGAQKSFTLHGLASTEITIWERLEGEQEPKKIMHWTVEIGDSTSPGCHFHTQVKCGNAERKPLSVPRLPSLLHTPMDAVEFLLAELFQDEWNQHTARENDFLKNWAHCQKLRLTKLLEWQLEEIRNTSGSPWTAFKKQKPPFDLFFTQLSA